MAEIPIATAVGWAVSPVMKLVINKTQNYIENKLFKQWGIHSEMEKMKMNLNEIILIMETFEKQRIQNPNHVELVHEIKDAVYEAEDVIDDFEYNFLEEKSRKQNNMVSQVASSSCCVVKNVTDLMFKKKVAAVIKKLDQAKGSAKTLHELTKEARNSIEICASNHENDIVTSSQIIDEIIGRQRERKQLMDLLFNQVDKLPMVIPIVGQGGMGKTTLAQLIFNDPSVNDHFHHKVWLSVFDNFDKIRLTKEMVKHVCKDLSIEQMSFDTLQHNLGKELEGKKVLLALDDVWYNKDVNENYSYKQQWKQLLVPLIKAETGSKIILTTREDIVGRILGTVPSMSLNGLTASDSWSLFELCAFDSDNNKSQDLELVGKEIVEKLKGSALAIKVVGSQLRGNQDIQEWERVCCDNMLGTNDIMNILRRSYEHLPEHLRRCFAYCSLFPKDYHFKPDQLIHMWIAQGFVHFEGNKNLEDVEKSYFKELLARSFFQVLKQGKKEYYVMHDLMNDLASYVSKGECYRLDDEYDPIQNLGSIRHLSVTYEAINILMNICNLEKLRTLILLGPRRMSSVDIKNLVTFKRIRVLHIEFMLSNLSDISECKHLRYLSLRSKPGCLPDCFGNLHHLSALFLRKGPDVCNEDFREILPKFLCSMRSLLVIHISKSICVDVGEQFEEKVLTLLRGGSAYLNVKKNGNGLDLLGYMNNIKGRLEITGLENVTSRNEAIKAQFGKKNHVTELLLETKYNPHSSEIHESSKSHEVFEILAPSRNLEGLNLRGYPAATWPSWLESNLLSSVKSIHLFKCMGIKVLPPLGILPLLRSLQIEYLSNVRRIGEELYGNGRFPSLEYLEIAWLESLEEWCYPGDSSVFPRLQALSISGVKLERFALPTYMQTKLNFLEMSSCDKLITLADLDQLLNVQILDIQTCSKLFDLPEMECFYSLEHLIIFDCPNISSLPRQWFPDISSLPIQGLPNISSLPRQGLPVSLRHFCIGGCMNFGLERQIRDIEDAYSRYFLCSWERLNINWHFTSPGGSLIHSCYSWGPRNRRGKN